MGRFTRGTPVGTATPAGQSAGLFGFKISEDLFNLALIAVAVILGIIVLLAILAIVRNQVRQRRENTELNPIAEEDAQRIVRQKEEERRTALQTRHIAELEQQ